MERYKNTHIALPPLRNRNQHNKQKILQYGYILETFIGIYLSLTGGS